MEKTITELIAEGENQFNQEHYRQAADFFSKAYQREPTLALNRQLVMALKADQQYELAQEYAFDFLSEYRHYDHLFFIYFDLLLLTQKFVTAQKWALSAPQSIAVPPLLEKIRTKEGEATRQQEQTLKTIAQHFYHLSDESLADQHDRYQQALSLPVSTFVTGAKFLLVDPFATPLMRSTLLSDLQELGVTGTVTYQWLDGKRYEVVLKKLNPVFENPVFQALMANLDEEVGQEDPVAYQALADQLRLETLLLFPRLAESVLDPVTWVKTDLTGFYQGNPVDEGADQQASHHLVLQALGQLAES